MRRALLTGILLPALLSAGLWAQTVSRTELSIATSATLDPGGAFPRLITSGSAGGRFVPVSALRINGSAFFALPDTLRFFHGDLEERTLGYALFKGASAEMPLFLGSGLDAALFTGIYTDPSSDDLLRRYQKKSIEPPRMTANLAARLLPVSLPVEGTGIALAGVPGNGNTALALYSYWDGKPLDRSVIRNDFRAAMAAESLRCNLFAGSRLSAATADVRLRGALTASFGNSDRAEFFAGLGVRDITPGSDMERKAYLMFEPRLRGDWHEFAFSFFSAPMYAVENDGTETYGGTFFGSNLLLALGSLERKGFRGGLAVSGAIDPSSPGRLTPVSFSVNPFVTLRVSDYEMDAALTVNPFWLDDPALAGELTLSLKAVY